MAGASVRYQRLDGGLDELLRKLENPEPFLREEGQLLASELQKTQFSGLSSGTLKKGLNYARVYRRGNTHVVWIGDHRILTNQNQPAPKGTIRDFVEWLNEQNNRSQQRATVAGKVSPYKQYRSFIAREAYKKRVASGTQHKLAPRYSLLPKSVRAAISRDRFKTRGYVKPLSQKAQASFQKHLTREKKRSELKIAASRQALALRNKPIERKWLARYARGGD